MRNGNHEARGAIGNRSRTGMGRPVGSGSPILIGRGGSNINVRVSAADRVKWEMEARDLRVSLGTLVRTAMIDYFDRLEE